MGKQKCPIENRNKFLNQKSSSYLEWLVADGQRLVANWTNACVFEVWTYCEVMPIQ